MAGKGLVAHGQPPPGAVGFVSERGCPRSPKKRTRPGRTGPGHCLVHLGLIARFANETSNLAAGRGQPVAMPGPARSAHRIQSVWVRLVTTRQKLDCLPVLRSVPPRHAPMALAPLIIRLGADASSEVLRRCAR